MTEPLLEARGVVKRFGHVQALQGADFRAHAGEVVALVGDNGAGKSTLVNVLSGVVAPDAGEILLDGRLVRFSGPQDAQRLGVETVYQDLSLAQDLDAPTNLYLGRELLRGGLLGRLGVLDRTTMRREAVRAFAELGVTLKDPSAPVATLSGGQRQSVAVARAVAFAHRVIFLDEPTAALGVVQRARVLDTVRRVAERGIAVVLISHNMPEVLSVADRVEVLRLGRRVASLRAADTTIEELVGAMTGSLDREQAAAAVVGGEEDARGEEEAR
ncbi:ATP-binding cassette domain-containing protein [Streptacidiphilus jiangxiensis]|uniref:Simple sugar transport system ATP-binding protein n=1 Tax=Streptacidiphilus jiangxiensis TaxID=235985 RepID=A0A1H7HLW5_STRJI|nr:ATP-binding cassette domain-containing protein [Streptacidiphilus jiangxiensis]SEK49980.1 simple sugar transport system ATP-binding protein [Streptacidiphilus jiangxiensis]